MASLLFCLLIVHISVNFHQPAEAVSEADVNRVLALYNAASDSCIGTADLSRNVRQKTADEACDKAFKALDEIRQNSCRGWRSAECRWTADELYPQCTCLISSCDNFAINPSIVTPFRNCAATLWSRESPTGPMPAPTTNFQQVGHPFDEAFQSLEAHSAFSYTGQSHWSGPGSSSGLFGSGGAGSSSGGHALGDAGGSGGMYSLEYGYPSAEYDYTSNAPAAPKGGPIIREPGKGHSKPFKCGECERDYKHKSDLQAHMKTHQSLDTYCFLCEYNLSSKQAFRAHMETMHEMPIVAPAPKKQKKSKPAPPEKNLPFACTICPNRYGSEHGLRDHMKSHTTDDTKCPECGRLYSTRGNMKIHMQNAHPGVPIPESSAPPAGARAPTIEPETGPFYCGQCGKKYLRKANLVDHELSHESLETYCIHCSKCLGSRSSYKNHMIRQHPTDKSIAAEIEAEYPVKCGKCDKRFKNIRGLKEHMPFHDGKTKCHQCNIVFPRKSALSEHNKKEHTTSTSSTLKRKERPK